MLEVISRSRDAPSGRCPESLEMMTMLLPLLTPQGALTSWAHRSLGILVSATMAAFALLALPSTTPAAHAATGDGFPGNVAGLAPISGGLLFGVHLEPTQSTLKAGSTNTLTNTTIINDFETDIGRKMDVHRIFLRWNSDVPSSIGDTVIRQRTPILSFAATRTDGSKVSYASIASGAMDADIRKQAAAIAALKVPVFLSFQHEPDVATGFGTPAEYVAAWQHYVDTYRAAGVTNVAWTWIMVPSSFLPKPVGAGAAAYYPGNDYVDYNALDGYNWFGCQADKPQEWRPMTAIATNFRNFGLTKGKPLMLAEFGSVEDPAQPGRKAAWLKETMATLASWPEFRVVSYFNTFGNCSWWADSSGSALTSFRAVVASAQAHGRANATMKLSAQRGAAPLTVSFNGSSSAGAGYSSGSGVSTWRLDFGDGTTASGTGTPPGAWVHTYGSGKFRAVLRVQDPAGHVAHDTRYITVANAPTFAGNASANLTTSSIDLKSWVNPQGLPTTLRYQWGTVDGVYDQSSGAISLPALTYTVGDTYALTGLRGSTRYYWRAVASNATGTTVSRGWLFTTPGAPGVVTKTVYSITRTGATLSAGATSYGAATTARIQWARNGVILGSQAWSMDAGACGQYLAAVVTGLAPGTGYTYRLTATNSYGTSSTAWVGFTTRS